MRVYIAGAMTGVFKYKEKFIEAEEYIRGLGHIVLNPSFLPEGLSDYYEINKAMIDQCDAIYVLLNYENSKGTLIVKGKKTINDVPPVIREQVKQILIDLDLPELAE